MAERALPTLVDIGAAVVALDFENPRLRGGAGAAFPILTWLVVTGACYSPLVGG